MPPGKIHRALDLIIFGDIYEEVHSYKDEPAQWLNRWHRRERHGWYQRFPLDWDLEDPFPNQIRNECERVLLERGPDSAEIEQVKATHDYFDRLWDVWDRAHRRFVARFLAYLIRHPQLLKLQCGVDALGEKVHRRIAGIDVWESAPGLMQRWLRLSSRRVNSRTSGLTLTNGGC